MSELLNIAHGMARDLWKTGAMSKITLKEIESLCLPPKKLIQAEDIKRIRKTNNVSQAALAAFLGIGKSTVQQWEQGINKRPGGTAQRPLDLIDRKGLAVLYG